MKDRLEENFIDSALDACLKDALEGDAYRARQLHELLTWCLTEKTFVNTSPLTEDMAKVCKSRGWGDARRSVAVTWWLTDYARGLLAAQHQKISKGQEVKSAVYLKPLPPKCSQRPDSGDRLRNKAICIAMDAELQTAKSDRDAAKKLAHRGWFKVTRHGKKQPMGWERIREIYGENTKK